jgi:Mrp family chromosome partitioning ATPase
MDQLQAFLSEAGLLYDAEPEFEAGLVERITNPSYDLLRDSEPEIDAADYQDVEQPVAEPSPTAAVVEGPATPVDLLPLPRSALPPLSAVVEKAATLVDEVPAPAEPPLSDVEIDGPGAEFTQETCLPAAQPPAVAPVASDPYTATAQQILRQLPRGRAQVLLFTSPADGQGKTMTLARLAPLLARDLKGDVLVVDANFRNPDMARRLAVAPTWCLRDVLAGAADWAAAVQTTAHSGVSLLPGGTDVAGRKRGQNVQGASRLFRDLAGHYDLVVVDAPSLAHRGTAELAAACDATYLVVRLGEGSPRMLREAAHVVQGNGGRLLGCVAIDAGA